MKNLLLMLLLILHSSTIFSQTCSNNPNSIDQYPIVSINVIEDLNSLNNGTIYGCKGIIKVSFTLHDNNNPSGLMPEWFIGNIELKFDNSAQPLVIKNVQFINLNPGSSQPIYEYSIEMKNYNVRFDLTNSFDAEIQLIEMDPSNGFNQDWDWAYSDQKNCGGQFMGNVLYDQLQSIYYAVGNYDFYQMQNNYTIQSFMNSYNVVLTNGQYCQNSNLKLEFDFRTAPRKYKFYCLFDVELYKLENNQYQYIGTYSQIPIAPILMKPSYYRYKVDIDLPLSFSPQNDYYIKLANFTFREGPTLSSKPLSEAQCWQWSFGQNFLYGATPVGYKTDFIKIGKRTRPTNTLSSGCIDFSGAKQANQTFNLNNITNKGFKYNPITTCYNLNLNIFKSLDINQCANYPYKYKVQLYECSPNFEEIALKGQNLDIFNGNTSTTFSGTNATLFNSYILNLISNGYAGPKYFKIVYKGYVDNCPDFDEKFKEIYFILSPGAVPNLSIKVNGVGNSTNASMAKFQKPVRISAGYWGSVVNISSNKPLYTSYVNGRLRKATASGEPDMTNAGIIWNSNYNQVCYPPQHYGYGSLTSTVWFSGFDGNSLGFGGGFSGFGSTSPGCTGNYYVSNQSCPVAWTDLNTFIANGNKTFLPFNGCDIITTSGPQQLHSNLYIDPSLYSTIPQIGTPITKDLFLEIYTTDDCGGNSPSSFLKLNIFEPVDIPGKMSFDIQCNTGDKQDPYDKHENWLNSGTLSNLKSDFENCNCPLSTPLSTSGNIYNIGSNTGYIEVRPKIPGNNMNIDYIVLKIEQFTNNGWRYIFDSVGENIFFYNNKVLESDLTIYNPFKSVKLPINDPYGDYEYQFYGTKTNLWMNGGYPNMFKTADPNNLYRVRLIAGHRNGNLNRLNISSNNCMINGTELIGYFMCNNPSSPGTLNNRSVQQTTHYQTIEPTGEVNFYLNNNRLYMNLVMPEGGAISFSLYDLSGRELYNSPQKHYETGVYKEIYDVPNLIEGIYIVNYKLNGIENSVKFHSK